MCNACGFLCCANDDFGGCGCDCAEPECLSCSNCDADGHEYENCPAPTPEDLCDNCGGQEISCSCTEEQKKAARDAENAYWDAALKSHNSSDGRGGR